MIRLVYFYQAKTKDTQSISSIWNLMILHGLPLFFQLCSTTGPIISRLTGIGWGCPDSGDISSLVLNSELCAIWGSCLLLEVQTVPYQHANLPYVRILLVPRLGGSAQCHPFLNHLLFGLLKCTVHGVALKEHVEAAIGPKYGSAENMGSPWHIYITLLFHKLH